MALVLRLRRSRTAATALVIGIAVAALTVVVDELRARYPAADALFAPRPGPQHRIAVTSLQAFRDTVFFDAATRKPAVWYVITAAGELDLFDAGGLHPETGERLKPVTEQVVQQLERRLRAAEQQRAADAERRAATARADAEIARVRRLAKSGIGDPPRTDDGRRSVAQAERPPMPAGLAPGRSDARDIATFASDRARATQYDDLVRDARALLDAGRPEEARAQAQRALRVDSSRMAARALWAEAQTMVDEFESRRSDARRWAPAPFVR